MAIIVPFYPNFLYYLIIPINVIYLTFILNELKVKCNYYYFVNWIFNIKIHIT
jgi:hypothetical protein